MPYDHSTVEPKWQARWRAANLHRTPDDPAKPKFYALDMFPYPSGAGLHVGHCEGYTATDVITRWKRMAGFRVLHPMGWDAFGLPAENYAIKHGVHPRETTKAAIANFRRQIDAVGFAYDWSREIDTTDPHYVKWTQWIFLKLYERDLAYEGVIAINWCPSCKTGLANEEVSQGRCERCGTLVVRKDMRQWLLRITRYADRLLEDLGELDWPSSTVAMQRNWIGRSEGAEVLFTTATPVAGREIRVFTTRPDTLYGATYMVLSPEHALVAELTTPERRAAVAAYQDEARRKSDLERTDLAKDKTGVFTGATATNPVTGRPIPIWIADYVLAGYGTGAIMAVPAHDERDFAFATKFGLPVVTVVEPSKGSTPPAKGSGEQSSPSPTRYGHDLPFTGEGVSVNSGPLDGLPTAEAKRTITRDLEARGLGKSAISYRLRDWVFSRQRYWGEPIPLVHCATDGVVPVPESALPVRLPDVETYAPTGTGESPLAGIDSWVATTCPKCGGPARRETNTMPQWAGSCWYYLRYLDPKNDARPFDRALEKQWMAVDLYVGGGEHAVLHLLYARFWHKVLFDEGVVKDDEPFLKLVHQGTILGENNEKMSKSRGNVVSPDDVVRDFGAASLRLYEMFMGPLEQVKPWQPNGIQGVRRFLDRVYVLGTGPLGDAMDAATQKLVHKTIRKITQDIESLRFNTAVSAMMILARHLAEISPPPREGVTALVLLLSPFAPHLGEELWQRLGYPTSLAYQPWPVYDEALCRDDVVEIAVQVNGKVRGRITLAPDAPESEARRAAEADPNVAQHLGGEPIKKFLYVPGKIVNVV